MKALIIFLIVIIINTQSVLTASNISKNNTAIFTPLGIKDGWYQATVKYSNYATATNATYTLKVKVQYNSVVEIDFGNGGSVHSGYNNEGYIYSGGYLSTEQDSEGNTISASATVSTSDSNGLKYFKILIE